jgi:hypothetical protein
MNRSLLCDNLRHVFAVMMVAQRLVVLFVYPEPWGLLRVETQK